MQSMVLLTMIILGYLYKRVGIYRKDDYRVITKTVMYATLPCTIINGFSRFEWSSTLLCIPVFALAVNIILQFISYILSRNGDREDKIFYMLNTPGFSTGTFAIPFIQNVLGTEGIVAACMFDVFGTIMPSGVSYVCATTAIEKKNREKGEQKERIHMGFIVKKLLSSPPFVANLCMIVIKMNSIALPEFISRFVAKVADANSFICMFMIGMMFELKIQKKYMAKVLRLLAVRLLISTLAAGFILCLLPVDLTLRKALTVVIYSPIASMSLVYTDRMEGDTELAGFANSLTIIASMVIMTALMAVL
ncbi:MAG: AEC family transporter [Clostridiales bacterium]|nr:AEC family transporter [Clostridiales bacterium]